MLDDEEMSKQYAVSSKQKTMARPVEDPAPILPTAYCLLPTVFTDHRLPKPKSMLDSGYWILVKAKPILDTGC